ncbi:ABC transporter permease [Cereibacter sphaeroides]|nr:ABC transporter permease [Cereibacter sphaeroides]
MIRITALLARKLGGIVATILAIATLNFVLVHSAPGDPALIMAGQSGATDAQFLEQVRAEYGLDQPFLVQLGTYLGKLVQFDLGYSFRQRMPVAELIADRLVPTLLLAGAAFALSLIMGVTLGALAGLRQGKWMDTAISIVTLLFYAMPAFWLGLMLILVFAIQTNLLPAFGYTDIRAAGQGPLAHALDVARHLILPAVTLGAIYTAVYTKLMRSAILEVSHEDHVKTARAKGLTEGRILRGHMLRNASVPVVTFAGLQTGALIGGAVVVETVFAWPGLGRLTFDAVTARDYPVLLGLFLVMSILVIAVNLLTDLLHRLIDPRVAAR